MPTRLAPACASARDPFAGFMDASADRARRTMASTRPDQDASGGATVVAAD